MYNSLNVLMLMFVPLDEATYVWWRTGTHQKIFGTGEEPCQNIFPVKTSDLESRDPDWWIEHQWTTHLGRLFLACKARE